MRTDARELLAVGMLGRRSRLGDRIEVLLRRSRTFSPHVSIRDLTASSIVLGALMLAGALAPRWIAFAEQQPESAFEVASIKTNKGAEGRSVLRVNPEGISYTSVTLMQCIAEAYQVRYSQISGHELPAEKYNIEAKAAGAITKEQSRFMLQALLADRFKLRLHHEARVVPVYKLVAGKNGPTSTSRRVRAKAVSYSVRMASNSGTCRCISSAQSDRPPRPPGAGSDRNERVL